MNDEKHFTNLISSWMAPFPLEKKVSSNGKNSPNYQPSTPPPSCLFAKSTSHQSRSFCFKLAFLSPENTSFPTHQWAVLNFSTWNDFLSEANNKQNSFKGKRKKKERKEGETKKIKTRWDKKRKEQSRTEIKKERTGKKRAKKQQTKSLETRLSQLWKKWRSRASADTREKTTTSSFSRSVEK